MKHVKCGLCHQRYPAIFSRDASMGRGCASEVTNGRLIGHYGSEVADMAVLEFSGKPLPDGTLVCDACVTRGLKSGFLRPDAGQSGRPADAEELARVMSLLDKRS